MTPDHPGTATIPVKKVSATGTIAGDDIVAVEEPLGIRLAWGAGEQYEVHDIAVTMRTPGRDADLALGFLFTEGILRAADEVLEVGSDPDDSSSDGGGNTLRVSLRAKPEGGIEHLRRNFYVSSSCGVCGKASIDAITTHAAYPVRGDELKIGAEVLLGLPQQLVAGQRIYAGTGSIHAAALFAADGVLGEVCEDVGRHNAVDKLIGSRLRANRIPLWNQGLIVSGRASFELVQKARMAGAAMLVAVGAPSSLAIELAWESDMSLIGFLRDGRFNIYTGPARIVSEQ